MSNGSSTAHGFALVAALFLIVVLAALGLFAVRLSSAQQQSIDLEVLGARAQAAANAGIEYAANQALVPSTAVCNPAPVTLNLNQNALQGFTAQVSCVFSSHRVIGSTPPACPAGRCPVYELKATATSGTYGSHDFVSRVARKTVSKVPAP